MTTRCVTAWDTAWSDGGTPSWETGRPQPVVEALVAEGAFGAGARVLDVGCGSGTHALLVAGVGAAVVGVDVAAAAVERAWARLDAAALSGSRGSRPEVAFAVGDALELGKLAAALGGPFDAALDVGLFHVLQPADRTRYASALAAAIRPGGRAFVVAWSDRNPFGIGPARVTRRELRAAFSPTAGWRVDRIEDARLETLLPMGSVHAWLARLTRR